MRRLALSAVALAAALTGCGQRLGTPAPSLASFAAAVDPRLELCNDQFIAPVDVLASFEIPRGQDYRAFLPNMGVSPELEGVSGAYVVVYRGEQTIRFLTGQAGVPRDPTADNVVCVVTRDGTPNIYSDVSRQGLLIPSPPVPVPSQG